MATAMYFRLMVLLAKIEGTYATDPTLTGASDAILAKNITIRPMEGEDVSRDLIQPYLGNQGTIPTGLRVVIEFDTELQGSGTAGTAPKWGPLMRGCGAAEVIVADTSVTYSPISTAMESLYFKFWLDGTLHAMKGARGTGKATINAQGIPIIHWTFTGLWIAPADVANASPTLTGFKKPLVATAANTPTFTVNAVPLVLRNYSFDLGNKVEARLLIGRESVLITDRSETLDITCEAVPIATLNVYGLANAQTLVAASIVHGTAAGYIATINAPTSQLKRPNGYQNNQGIAEWQLSLAPQPSSGNDQWSLVLT
jgi:hypothetical protein